MNIWQFMLLMFTLQCVHGLIFGMKINKEDPHPFKTLWLSLKIFVTLSLISFYSLKYLLPIIIEMIRNA